MAVVNKIYRPCVHIYEPTKGYGGPIVEKPQVVCNSPPLLFGDARTKGTSPKRRGYTCSRATK